MNKKGKDIIERIGNYRNNEDLYILWEKEEIVQEIDVFPDEIFDEECGCVIESHDYCMINNKKTTWYLSYYVKKIKGKLVTINYGYLKNIEDKEECKLIKNVIAKNEGQDEKGKFEFVFSDNTRKECISINYYNPDNVINNSFDEIWNRKKK